MKQLYYLFFLSFCFSLSAQEALTYQKPPAEILSLAEAPLAPSIRIDADGKNIILLYRSNFKSIEELSETELRLGGLRINPVTNIGSRVSYYNDIKLQDRSGTLKTITNLPENGRFAYVSWSNDQQHIAFTNTTNTGVELWVADVNKATAKRLTDATLNANMRRPFTWLSDNASLLVKKIGKNRQPLIDSNTAIPTGPTISESEAGVKAQNRTYQDLLKNKNDEHNFEQLALSELYKISIDGNETLWKGSDMYNDIDISPDGKYIMVTTIKKPFSYLVPFSRFPEKTDIYAADGTLVASPLEVPLIEDLPQGFMAVRTGKRNLSWRNDEPSTLVWCEALDGGDPENEVPFRDEVFQQKAPYSSAATSLLKTKGRYSGIIWGNATTAIARDYWWNTRNTKSYVFDPSDASKGATMITDRNYQDVYSDPGNFETKRNDYGQYVLDIVDDNAYLTGDGYQEDGKFPFVDKFNLKTLKTERVYQSKRTDQLESIVSILNTKEGELLVRIESKNEFPNYYIQHLKKRIGLQQLTHFENPFKSIQNVKKEVINYTREDGLPLTGTLYLPTDYEEGKKYPMVMWAYPREYKDKNSASQSTSNSNEFTYPNYGSPIYWVTRGYVVLDDASFPIVGEGDEQPNDTFVKQLVGNAKAAIDAVDNLGYIDSERVAVGGHSYGAFMTANLLAHSNLFAAGIARSGAYNRTLTPFGFQSEERNYWEAPEIYYNMSPFMHADTMKTPLLLIHGEADNNSGTYPLQSERYFNALKGLGAPVRLVMLPKESHGYRAQESILHMLWEQDSWLETHVKNKSIVDKSIKADKKAFKD